MSYVCVTITTENPDETCAVLYGMDITSVEIEDNAAFEDFLENNKKYWDYIDESVVMPEIPKVKFYMEKQEFTDEIKTRVLALSDSVEISEVKEEDWANNWKEYYKPLHIGKSVVVKPCWEEYEPKMGEKIITLDPGAAFGTGAHETTSMCIELIEKYINPSDTALDIGCGSGILSVAASVLGASKVVAVDIDPLAVKTTMENAELNGIEKGKITATVGDLTDKVSGRFNLVIANIVADVIISLLPTVPAFLEDNGIFICSGIINDRADEVRDAILKMGFVILEESVKRDWHAFSLKRGQYNA